MDHLSNTSAGFELAPDPGSFEPCFLCDPSNYCLRFKIFCSGLKTVDEEFSFFLDWLVYGDAQHHGPDNHRNTDYAEDDQETVDDPCETTSKEFMNPDAGDPKHKGWPDAVHGHKT